jgi:hypothetical protein
LDAPTSSSEEELTVKKKKKTEPSKRGQKRGVDQTDVASSEEAQSEIKPKKASVSSKFQVRTYCRASERFFTEELKNLVYPVYSVDEFALVADGLRGLHSPKAVASTTQYQLFTRKTGIINPRAPVWTSESCYAPMLVSFSKTARKPDWRFTLGFGQKFDLGASAIDHYCAGFVHSTLSNRCAKTMLVFLAENSNANEGKFDKRVIESVRQFPFRLLRLKDIVGAHVPVIVGDINDLPANSIVRANFFKSVHDLFSPGGTLPPIYSMNATEVYCFKPISFLLTLLTRSKEI